jgi:hypothetical protein
MVWVFIDFCSKKGERGMKKWLVSLAGVFVLFSASAATIQWGTAQNISSDSDVPSVSTYSARNVGGSATETVNGVAVS